MRTSLQTTCLGWKIFLIPLPIDDSFPNEQLAIINASRNTPWYADYANYIVAKFIPSSFTYQQKKVIL